MEETLDNLSKLCKYCQLEQPVSNFHKNKYHKDGKSYKCKTCTSKYSKLAEWRRNIRDEASRAESGISKRYAQDRLSYYRARSKVKQIPCTIDSDYLIELWKTQSGKCAYTSTEMTFQRGKFSFFSPSLDKINPELGYIKGNVVWALHGVNCFKQRLPLKDFISFIERCSWSSVDDIKGLSVNVQ